MNKIKEYGFDWNDESSIDLGLVVESKEIPLIPERKVIKKEIPGIDGTIDYDLGTSKNITIKVKCYFKENTIEKLQQFKWKIKHWLNTGEGRLSFHDEYDKYYIGRLKNQIPLEELANIGRFTLIFECKPFAFSKHTSNKELSFETPWAIDAGFKLDVEPTVWQIAGNITKTVYNWGMESVKPIIMITGSFEDITITCNGVNLNYNASLNNETLVIDCENKTAKIDNQSVLKNMIITPNEWDTIEFVPGDNTLNISGTYLNCEVSLIFRGKY